LAADSDKVAGWRNIGQTEAMLFWIVVSPATAPQPLEHRVPGPL
jgi:hypothetical protein